MAHPKVAEAAVVGFPHEIKGQGIYAYVTLMAGEEYTDDDCVEGNPGPARPQRTSALIASAGKNPMGTEGLPKTRSGKIMRVAENDTGSIGDTSTLADPSVVADLIENDPRQAAT